MNILLSMPDDKLSNVDIVGALCDLGHEVFYVDHRANLENAKEFVSYYLQAVNIDVMLVLHLWPGDSYDKDAISGFQTLSPNTKFVAWMFDTICQGKLAYENDQFIEQVKCYDAFFTMADCHVDKFREKGVNAFWCPQGFGRHCFVFSRQPKWDVSFIGQVDTSVYQTRRHFLNKIIKRFDNTKIYGATLSQDSNIVSHHAKRATVGMVDFARVVSYSKINLSFSGIIYGEISAEVFGLFSARQYRLMGCGGFTLASRTRLGEEMFVDGEDLVFFDDAKDCIEKIGYYLEHEDERIRIADCGRDTILNEHTMTHSLTKLLRTIE